jgi:two-component system, OmpR family, alkaline phosphatase synthesis response regulator PhoP
MMTLRRILLIDDEEDIREVLQTCLEMIGGWEVFSAFSGHVGIEMAKAKQPDAILLDVMMPDIDGPSTLRLLQAEPTTKNIPVIMLTAKAQAAEQSYFANLKVYGVLKKPFDPLRITEQIQKILGWSD